MRVVCASAVLLLVAGAAFGGTKKVTSPETSAGNEQVDIVAKITMGEDAVKDKIGIDPGPGYALLELRVIPKTDKPLQVDPNDFILLAHDDGERSRPFEPSEIAGNGALVLTDINDGTKVKKTSSTVGFGGIMGGGGSPGNSRVVALSSKVDDKAKGNEQLLEALKAKQFPTKESIEPVEGYLYFPLNGKHKLKNLAVLYRGPAGKLNLEFEH